jgi:hypothetical protein
MTEPITDEEFRRKYRAYDRPSIDDLIRLHMTDVERHEVIGHLISEREADSSTDNDKKPSAGPDSPLEEIARFRDIMALHKRLLKYDDEP